MQGCFCMPFETCTTSSFGGNPSVSHVSRPPFKIEPCRSAEVRPGCLPARGACIPVSAYRRLSHFRSPPRPVTNHGAVPLLQHAVSCGLCAKLGSTGGVSGVRSGLSHLRPEEILQQSRRACAAHGGEQEFLSLLEATYAGCAHTCLFS